MEKKGRKKVKAFKDGIIFGNLNVTHYPCCQHKQSKVFAKGRRERPTPLNTFPQEALKCSFRAGQVLLLKNRKGLPKA
jgi:hypothetical protein